jgi:hypothetical protein
MTCVDGDCVAYMLIASNSAQCGYSSGGSSGSRGGGGGTYPPNWDKPKNVTTGSSGDSTLPPAAEPEPEAEEADVPGPTATTDDIIVGGPVGNDSDGNETDEDFPESPGFAGVFVILGILIVAYLHYRKKQ